MSTTEIVTNPDLTGYENYSHDDVWGLGKLTDRMADAETLEDWSFILGDYIKVGNHKIAKNVAVFNLCAAADCPNIDTDRCQVPKQFCYAYRDERTYQSKDGRGPLSYRRRQEYLWDCLDAETFAGAFSLWKARKTSDVEIEFIRFNESGDIRHRGDILKIQRIAEILQKDGVSVYLYSASNQLEWDILDERSFVVNASNDEMLQFADQRFGVVKTYDTDSSAIVCPFDASDQQYKCGECRLCMTKHGKDIHIEIH